MDKITDEELYSLIEQSKPPTALKFMAYLRIHLIDPIHHYCYRLPRYHIIHSYKRSKRYIFRSKVWASIKIMYNTSLKKCFGKGNGEVSYQFH